MKRIFAFACLVAAAVTLSAQQKPQASPPETASATIGGKSVTST